MKFRFWCEFPDDVDWEKLAKWLNELDMDIEIYTAVRSRKDFDELKKKIFHYSEKINVNPWPVLDKKDGYWFSGFVSKENIDLLDDFKDLKIKIDVEPPLPDQGYTLLSGTNWILGGLFKKSKNSKYLREKIKKLDKETKIIASSFPMPKFMLRRFGWEKAKENNFMFYPSFVPLWIRWLYRFVYKFFIKMNKDANIAIGLIGVGIFGDEPIYKNISEFKTDLEFLEKNKVKKCFIFELSAVTRRGKEWLKVIKDYS
tara:strand:- start:6224 stop:6994 length:771 start_codon:yes stop_codon:yes gene_type:complete